jgi:hypothetical protein
MIYHPDFAHKGGSRNSALTQTTDIMPTMLDMAGIPIPEDVTGHSLMPVLQGQTSKRESVIFGYFGAAVNVCDGRYSYFHYPTVPGADHLHEYTLMPTRMTTRFSIRELLGATLHPSFAFTKGVPVLRLDPKTDDEGEPVEVQGMGFADTQSQLFDLVNDPGQAKPIESPDIVERLRQQIIKNMMSLDAPDESYRRFGFAVPGKHAK